MSKIQGIVGSNKLSRVIVISIVGSNLRLSNICFAEMNLDLVLC